MPKEYFIRRDGFTLIEIVAILVILGIFMISLAKPFSNFVSGFIFAQDVSELEQKSLLALSRIEKEMNLERSIDSASTAANLKFFPTADSSGRTTSTTAYSIRYDSTLKKIIFNDGTDFVLLDNVSSFTVTYDAASHDSCGSRDMFSLIED